MGYSAYSIVIWGINIDVPVVTKKEKIKIRHNEGYTVKYVTEPRFDKEYISQLFEKLDLDIDDLGFVCDDDGLDIPNTPYQLYCLENKPSKKSPWFVVLKMSGLSDDSESIQQVEMPTIKEMNNFNKWWYDKLGHFWDLKGNVDSTKPLNIDLFIIIYNFYNL